MEEKIFSNVGNKSKLVYRVVNEIQTMIVDGQIVEGQMLPSEREFAEQLGVSRTVIREAVHILVSKGLLDTKHGVGTIIRLPDSQQIVEPLKILMYSHSFSLHDLHQARCMLEVENTILAVRNALEEEVEELQKIIGEMAAVASEPDLFAKADTKFHHALAEMSHNALLVMLLDSLSGLMLEVRLSVAQYPDLVNTVIQDHFTIVSCIKNRDLEGARKAMLNHLDHALDIQQARTRWNNRDGS